MSDRAITSEPSEGQGSGARDAVFERAETIATWDAGYYHPIAVPFYDLAVERMINVMGIPPGETVLDAGCGPGEHSIRVARLGRRVHAIDISDAMLQEARYRVKSAQMDHMVEFQRQDLTQLDLPNNAFRHVFSWGVIIHIREVEKALAELARIVEPGGSLALWVTNSSAIDYVMEGIARRLLRRPLRGLERHDAGEGVMYEFGGAKLWVWRLDHRWLVDAMKKKGFRLRRRLMGSLTETHTRLNGLSRSAILRLNNAALRLGAPISFAVTNLFVFEKQT